MNVLGSEEDHQYEMLRMFCLHMYCRFEEVGLNTQQCEVEESLRKLLAQYFLRHRFFFFCSGVFEGLPLVSLPLPLLKGRFAASGSSSRRFEAALEELPREL